MRKPYLFLISSMFFLIASAFLPAMRLAFIIVALALGALSAVLLVRDARNKK